MLLLKKVFGSMLIGIAGYVFFAVSTVAVDSAFAKHGETTAVFPDSTDSNGPVGNVKEPTARGLTKDEIRSLATKLKGAVLSGSELPSEVKRAAAEVVKFARPDFSKEQVAEQVRLLSEGVVFIKKMDAFLDAYSIKDSSLRGAVKAKAAFTINQGYPVFINGEESTIHAAVTSNDSGKLAGVVFHEIIHANGEADEAVATEREIEFLQNLVAVGLVDREWILYRQSCLALLRSGKVSHNPMQVVTSKQ